MVQIAALMLGIVLILPLVPYAIAELASPIVVPNPGSDLWRDARGATQGVTQAGGTDAGVLISDLGEKWRAYRVDLLAPYGALILGGMIGIFVLYFLIRGRIRIEDGRSGRLIRRYTSLEMWVHWFLAISFVVLALTGLILLYGRWVLIPVLGPEGFHVTANLSKYVHNYVGPLFSVLIPIAFFMYFKDSLFNIRVDLAWFLRAGGYLGGGEPSSEKVNAGQKTWYWVAMLGGAVIVGSGLILDFPIFGQGRQLMQLSHLLHTIASVIVIAFFFVHFYLATVGVEGAFESMVTGYVDENWAKQHHDLWHEEVQHTAVDEETAKAKGGGSGMVGEQKPA